MVYNSNIRIEKEVNKMITVKATGMVTENLKCVFTIVSIGIITVTVATHRIVGNQFNDRWFSTVITMR